MCRSRMGGLKKRVRMGIEKIVGMIRGEDHRARRRQVLAPLDDNLAEEDLSDQAKKGEKHFCPVCPVYAA